MMDIRRIFARHSEVVVDGDAALLMPGVRTPNIVTESLIKGASLALIRAWPANAGPFFTSDGQSAVACVALWQTPEMPDGASCQ